MARTGAPKQVQGSHGIALQAASEDIWDSKYRLKHKDGTPIDLTPDATWQRVARALSEVEADTAAREHWYERFLWALRNGAIPAGRIISNAGAQDIKPATSTINCTVSGTIRDSMDDILGKVHEAGLTLKAGCGIGYEFSTLRPRGAYVSGSGAQTSGPLSFMDIYDKMCFTVSSAGGRRGAQMGTFDVCHPDVREFIRAKREDGRLRQFNLSLLVSDAFMHAVENDTEWPLLYPVHPKERDELDFGDSAQVIWRDWPVHDGYFTREDGLVACKVYGRVQARHLWDMIMVSTYDFAEPGFILIDRVNELNNNWWCEAIRATNPCVTADTWVHTAEGPRQVRELLGKPFCARVDGVDYPSTAQGFFQTGIRPVLALRTREGYQLRLTADHRVRRVTATTRWRLETQWCAASELRPGDQVLLADHRANAVWPGDLGQDEGYLLGLLVGDGTLKADAAILSAWPLAAAENDCGIDRSLMDEALRCIRRLGHRADFSGWVAVSGRGEWRMKSAALRDLAYSLGMKPGDRCLTPNLERLSSDACRGFLRGFFDADGSVQGMQEKGVSLRLAQSDLARLQTVQRILLRLGVVSTLYRERRPVGERYLPDGRGGQALYHTQAQHELVISGESLVRYAELIGFADRNKAQRLETALAGYQRAPNRQRFIATVEALDECTEEPVFDASVPGINAFDGNGLHAHNCGEQPLPPYGSCLLGSINLTAFVEEPFSEDAHFDWERFRAVVRVFTRMLDNVVEINGLPLEQQREEILGKRRHGMGFLGLGSALALLRLRYGSTEACVFTEEVAREMALAGWQVALELAREKGPAPVLARDYDVTAAMLRKRPEMVDDGYRVGDRVPGRILHARYSRYMQRIAEHAPELVAELAEVGARFTHHSSIAPTGTISLSLANNASNGIEPSYAHQYSRNLIRPGRKTKEKIEVRSYELLAYRALVNSQARPDAEHSAQRLPDYFVSADDISPAEHVEMQAAAQKWIDSSISKTANVPTDFPFEEFKDIYLQAWRQGLKGCTTFRFNPAAFQGVLVKDADLERTVYRFELEDGTQVELRGNEEVEYDGEVHTAANLFEALKEGYYGKY
ncbi:LAGLIDADG family homing endonuclease [Pseudomonas sp. D(2018)]|uniref:LAGLIDADG family homing endonuclease n=1 Tax=Pseudomonas sp. D(2018) TaxID=2502238 RepID=UPI0010F53839|nr:LAGLIDADG family homing endonuclease [Pseudomonas sp. D(2018)]